MIKTQFAAFCSATAPYLRVLKFADKVPALHTVNMAAPVALGGAKFSPDGRLMIAWAASGTSLKPWKFWTIDDNYTFTEVSPTDLPIAGTIGEIEWIDDQNFVAIDTVNGLLHCTIDRTTNVLTYSRIETLASRVSIAFIDTEKTLLAVTATVTPLFRVYKRTGATYAVQSMTVIGGGGATAGTVNINFTLSKAKFDLANNIFYGARQGTAGGGSMFFVGVDNGKPVWVAPGVISALGTSTFTPGASTSQTYNFGAIRFSPSGKRVFYSLQEESAYYFHTMEQAGAKGTTWLKLLGRAAAPNAINALLPSYLLDINVIGNLNGDPTGIILLAVNSNVQTTGRVRGFYHNDAEGDPNVELPEIASFFNNWVAIITYIAVSPEIVTGQQTVQYVGAQQAFVARTADFNNLKVALSSASISSFDASHTTLAQALGANEVYGSSWPQGGIAVSPPTFEKFGTGDDLALKLVIPTFDLLAAGTINWRSAIIYDASDANKKPLIFFDFGANKSATQGDRMKISTPNDRAVIFKAKN